MNKKKPRILVVFVTVLLAAAATVALLQIMVDVTVPVHAQSGSTFTVCLTGPPDCDYSSIQDAVDAATDHDQIKVAAGTYTGLFDRSTPPGYVNPPASGTITQVVFVDKSVTIRGGYTTTNGFADPPAPQAYTTTLDAEAGGRVLFVSGAISPTIEGLRFTGGDASGLGGDESGFGAGGGVYIADATAILSGTAVLGNSASRGGGVYLSSSNATVRGNTITDNKLVSGQIYAGGGLYVNGGQANVTDNVISGNRAFLGGGVYLSTSGATLGNNSISGNYGFDGGGVYVSSSDASLSANAVSGNNAGQYGGGLYLWDSAATLDGNTVADNSAVEYGGGLVLDNSDATLSGNIVPLNSADQGGGIYVYQSGATLDGNTIFSNSARSGGGLYVDDSQGLIASGNIISGNTTTENGGGVLLSGGRANLVSNILVFNRAEEGGGFFLDSSDDATLSSNSVFSNSAESGGGLYLLSSDATLTNNVVADNQVTASGSGLTIRTCSPRLLHTTIAHNQGGDGTGLYVFSDSGEPASSVKLTNTILVSHVVGIRVTSGDMVVSEGALWGSGAWANDADWAGNGTIISGTVNVWDDPDFVAPDDNDYHIGPLSGAIGAGVTANTADDIDGDPRPFGDGADLGADEFLPPNSLFDVCPAGPPTCDFDLIQDAVDAIATGGVIRVAAGTYTDLHERPVPAGYPSPPPGGIVRQVVYISKTVNIRGGYTAAFAEPPDDDNNATVLDAQGVGRVIFITGDISPTLEGLRLTGGVASGLGGGPPGTAHVGGGAYISNAAVAINDIRMFNNSANLGGALYLDHSASTCRDNTISDNSGYRGGGVYLAYSDDAILSGNGIFSNTATDDGGGLYLDNSAATLDNNTVAFNAAIEGGGLYANASSAAMDSNSVTSNSAYNGGGLYLSLGTPRLGSNTIVSNSAGLNGGGLMMAYSDATFTNTIVADNQASGAGSGLFIWASSPQLLHTTIARNTGGDGSGVYVGAVAAPFSHAVLTNTVLVSHSVAVIVAAGSSLAAQGTLWGDGVWANGSDWDGAGAIITGTVNIWGDPVFARPDRGDYHIRTASAAFDAGVTSTLAVDIDGQSRPRGASPDIGADESYPPYSFHTVCRIGPPACDFAAVQDAVDAADAGGAIRVAGGVYTDVHSRTVPSEYLGPPSSGYITQVVHITKTLGVGGGYTTTNGFADPPDPMANPTTLDAQGKGRVIFVAGSISPTVQGLRLTGGDAQGLGGAGLSPLWTDVGGGLAVFSATPTISTSWVFSNTASEGGGMYLGHSDATLKGNAIFSNTAESSGGGVTVRYGSPALSDNIIKSNTSFSFGGGGVFLGDDGSTLSQNTIYDNAAKDGSGGGLFLDTSDAVLSGTTVFSNTADHGGGGLYLRQSDVTLTSNIIAENQAGATGSGLHIEASSPRLLHATVARNSGGDGSGLYVASLGGTDSSVHLTNTILVSHNVGITVDARNTAALEGTLWGSGVWANDADWGGDGTVHSGTVNLWGDPDFRDLSSGDYHIGVDSAAIDAGVEAGVNQDIDGEPRPYGEGYDIGADELGALLSVIKSTLSEVVRPGVPLTYTIQVTNLGSVDLHATVTDVLPMHTLPGGSVTWTPTITAPGGVWTQDLVVTVEIGYAGPMTNVVQVTSIEGATGVFTHTLGPDLEVTKRADPDVVNVGELLTYTIILTNTGNFDLHATVTDTLPDNVSPGGVLTWTPLVTAPGGVWTHQFVVTADVGCAGPITNVVQVTTEEGAVGNTTYTSTCKGFVKNPVYLPLVLRNN